MPGTGVVTLRLGACNTYLLPCADGFILIDAGNRGWARFFFRALRKRGIRPGEIRLIVLTHAHYDHVGCLQAIKERCGCPVMVRHEEAAWLERGEMVVPPGTTVIGKLASRLGRTVPGALRFKAVRPDIVLAEEVSLAAYGLDARVMHTPGHTHGSQTILLPGGEAFVGDLAINHLPFGRGPISPPFAEDVPLLLKSWERLLDAGAGVIYPGHGSPFPAVRLRDELDKRKRQ